MNKKYVYYLCLFLFAAAVIFIVVSYNAKQKDKENKVYTLLERKSQLAALPEWNTIKGQARKYIEMLVKDLLAI